MTNPILPVLEDEVRQSIGAMNSATTLINGIAQRISDAIAQALENGATAAELAPFTALENELEVARTALADAVAANPTR